MARTLIIKNADFSVNKVATVEIEEEVPCTGITLNKNTSAITSIGSTDTLTATASPSGTTDSVIWSTSDSNVATVAGGVITATGCGTATITATCGEYSATCSVTVTHIADILYELNRYAGKDNGKDYLTGGELSNYTVGGCSTGTKKIAFTNSTMLDGVYPVQIPTGANKITISSAGFKPYGFWVNSTIGGTDHPEAAFAYAPDDNFKYNSAVNDSRIVPIPDRTAGTYEGMNAAAFVFKCNSTITQEAVDAIIITFSKET